MSEGLLQVLLSGGGIAHHRLGDFFFQMGGDTASVQVDPKPYTLHQNLHPTPNTLTSTPPTSQPTTYTRVPKS